MGLIGQPRGVRIMQADERKATRLNLLPSRVTAGPGRKAGLALICGRAYYTPHGRSDHARWNIPRYTGLARQP